MAYECDDCGETFDTLSRLHLDNCGGDQVGVVDTAASDESRAATDTSSTEAQNASIAELTETLDCVADGETAAVHRAVGEFESALANALGDGTGGETYRDVFWPYYECVSDALDTATRSEGWALLGEVVEAYDPATEETLSLATPAVANAVGRYLIRTRVTEGVEAIPVAALEYLDAVAVTATDEDDIELEETHAYGWGIGHPDHAVVDRLRNRASEDVFSVSPTLEHAFYADQYAAVEALERLAGDESVDGTLSYPHRDDLSYRRYLLDSVYGLKSAEHWPWTPRYYDWREELAYSFELDESVEGRIRELVTEAGFDAELPDEWSLRDLGI